MFERGDDATSFTKFLDVVLVAWDDVSVPKGKASFCLHATKVVKCLAGDKSASLFQSFAR